MYDTDPSLIDLSHAIRAISFENPTGAVGAGGQAAGGRKGAPNRMMAAGERITLADISGSGRIRHVWMTFPPTTPEVARSIYLEVFYGGTDEPSISVPCLDFFGLPHGRAVPYASALQAVQEGRGFNSWIPMPFREGIRIEFINASDRALPLYYQIAFTEGPVDENAGLLHVSFRRDNPTTLRTDFVIAEGLRGPGRFLGCNVGIRVLSAEHFSWYGEGEVKFFLDDDGPFPTWCGTGLEDYVGTAWGMGLHQTPLQGVPSLVQDPASAEAGEIMPEFVTFYRWHLPDPIVFHREFRATLQQIGAIPLRIDQEDIKQKLEQEGIVAGTGWMTLGADYAEWIGICERVDDVCATAYLYCRDPQSVPRLDVESATRDLERRSYEEPTPFELGLAPILSD